MILPAQRPIAIAELREDNVTQDLARRTMVFPNLIVMLTPINGVLIGRHAVCSPQYANEFVAELPKACEHVTGCDCPAHTGKYMELIDPESDLS